MLMKLTPNQPIITALTGSESRLELDQVFLLF